MVYSSPQDMANIAVLVGLNIYFVPLPQTIHIYSFLWATCGPEMYNALIYRVYHFFFITQF